MIRVDDIPGVTRLADGRIQLRVTKQRGGKRKELRDFLNAGASRSQVFKRLGQLQEEVERLLDGAETSFGRGYPTVTNFVKYYLCSEIQDSKPRTRQTYEDALNNHVCPYIGHRPIDEIDRMAVVTLRNKWRQVRKKNGQLYSPYTQNQWFRVLRQVVKKWRAQFRELHDPFFEVDAPKLERSEHGHETETISTDQGCELLEHVRVHRPRWYAEIATFVLTGMRSGEVHGLHRDDIDLERGIIYVRYSVSPGVDRYTRGTPKTRAGTRRVPILPQLDAILREHLKQMRPGQKIVFPALTGTYRYSSSTTWLLRDAAKALEWEIRLSPQVLRRSFNTNCLRNGIDRATLRQIMGHVSDQMTQHYTAFNDDDLRKALLEAQPATPEGKEGDG